MMELFNLGNFSPPYSKLNQESKSDCGLHTVNDKKNPERFLKAHHNLFSTIYCASFIAIKF